MSYKKKLTTKIFGSRQGSAPDKSLEGRAHFVTRTKKKDGEEEKNREQPSVDDSIDKYYHNKMQRRTNQARGIGQVDEFGDEDGSGNNFDAQRY